MIDMTVIAHKIEAWENICLKNDSLTTILAIILGNSDKIICCNQIIICFREATNCEALSYI